MKRKMKNMQLPSSEDPGGGEEGSVSLQNLFHQT
jgi:hypothetical protein